MKNIAAALLCIVSLAVSEVAIARDSFPLGKSDKPAKAHYSKRKAFAHTETSKGKNSKAQFRHEAKAGVVDLRPGNAEKFKTARANPGYKYLKAR